MNGWLIALIVFAVFSAYTMVAAVTSIRVYRWRIANCPNCSRGSYCYSDHVGAAFVMGAIWPLSLAPIIGVVLATRESRDERRRRAIERLEKELGM